MLKSADDRERRAAHDRRLSAWRAENRASRGLPPLPPYVAPETSLRTQGISLPLARPGAKLTVGTHAPTVTPTAADLEFERVRKAALTRIAAEDNARDEAAAARAAKQRDEDAAVAAILGAMGIDRAGTQSTDTL